MRSLFRKLRNARFRYKPLISIFIYREHILHNLRQFQALDPSVAVAPVLKGNAYGHGLVPVAKMLAETPEGKHLPFFCVDSYFEALMLRNEGIVTPLVILGYTPLENIEHNKLKNVSFGITSLAALQELSTHQGRHVAIHLKIDTGMHRQGILMEELGEALKIIKTNPRITLEGVCSHLADADTPGSLHVRSQIERWNAAAREVRKTISGVRYFHLSNTAGSHYVPQIDANVMRIGIGLYGYNTSLTAALNLMPALEMKTCITSIRRIAQGESVGYNATFTADHDMTVATIPVGYAEGIDRRLSNNWAVMVGGIACPVVGRINMNMTSIDVSHIKEARMNDEVVVISIDRNAPNSIENIAKRCGTIPYEILTGLPTQIRRTII